jgi:Tol biopolymer transport system component
MKRVVFIVISVFLIPSLLFGARPGPPPAPFVPAIAYIEVKSPSTNLMLMNADGSQTKLLVAGTSTAGPRAPSFSPDGTKIVFRQGTALYVVPTAGGTPWKLVSLAEETGIKRPAWSPDGRFILYCDTSGPSLISSSSDRDLFLVEVDASGHAVDGSQVRLTSTPSFIEYEPAWSRDGSRFLANVWITSSEEQLFVFDFDTASRTISQSWSLTAALGKMYFGPWRAQWNKSSSAFPNDVVTFSAHFPNDGSNYDLWFIDVATLRAGHIVGTTANFEVSPSFSPDDTRIVFHNEPTTGAMTSELAFVENAADLINGVATVPVLTHTVAKAGRKVLDVYECDWKPVP